MAYSKGGRGKQAPYTTTHIRVPDPLKAEIQNIIEEWRLLVDSGELSPTEAVTEVFNKGGSDQLPIDEAVNKAKEILKQKKSANDSMIKLLTALYNVELPKDILGRKH